MSLPECLLRHIRHNTLVDSSIRSSVCDVSVFSLTLDPFICSHTFFLLNFELVMRSRKEKCSSRGKKKPQGFLGRKKDEVYTRRTRRLQEPRLFATNCLLSFFIHGLLVWERFLILLDCVFLPFRVILECTTRCPLEKEMQSSASMNESTLLPNMLYEHARITSSLPDHHHNQSSRRMSIQERHLRDWNTFSRRLSIRDACCSYIFVCVFFLPWSVCLLWVLLVKCMV